MQGGLSEGAFSERERRIRDALVDLIAHGYKTAEQEASASAVGWVVVSGDERCDYDSQSVYGPFVTETEAVCWAATHYAEINLGLEGSGDGWVTMVRPLSPPE